MELNLNKTEFETLHPFFVSICEEGTIESFGKSAPKCFLNIENGQNIDQVLTLLTPKNLVSSKDLKKLVGKIVTLKSVTTDISFNGEVIWIKDKKTFLFAITPLIQNVEILTTYNLTYGDFPAYSPLFDFFILIQAERFARKEQAKSFNALEEQISLSKLNLEIANFCSRSLDIDESLKFSLNSIHLSLNWIGESISSPSLNLEDICINENLTQIPLVVSGETRYLLNFKHETSVIVSEAIKIFLASLRYTLENLITRIDQHNSLQESQAQKVASSKMYTLGEMAAGIAHELNNPLAVIQGLAWVTMSNLQNSDFKISKLEENMDKIIKMTERSGKIIKGLRVFARDAAEDPMEKIELGQVIEDTLELCKSRINHRGIELIWVPETKYFSFGRAVQISQVFLNLLNNAADAIESSVEPWIKISIREKDKMWIISVTDSGPGISEEIVNKLMTPFFTTKPSGKGTGLGLSISSNILKSHQGQFWYEKECPNTCFSFSLPIYS
jgi:signal transduction histidine kinase